MFDSILLPAKPDIGTPPPLGYELGATLRLG